MKNLITGLMMTLVITTSAFASDDPGPRVVRTFHQQFKDATEVSWKTQPDGIIANFNFNCSRISAFFSNDGELLATARSIMFSQLPLIPVQSIEYRFSDAAPYDITEYVLGNQTFYVMTIETHERKYRVRVYGEGELIIEKREKK